MTTPPARTQSTFVTGLAWVMLLLNGFSVLGSLMQNVLINVFLPTFVASQADVGLASPMVVPMGLLRVLGLLALALAVIMTWSAWALLQRREWARRMYVSLFVLGIVVNVLGALAFWGGMRYFEPALLGVGDAPPETMHAILRATATFVAVLVVVTSVLYAWIVKRLTAPDVKAEFAAAEAAR